MTPVPEHEEQASSRGMSRPVEVVICSIARLLKVIRTVSGM
jgi:hypothetical protein